MLQEEQGWRTAAWVRFPGVTCGLSLLLVLVLAQRIQVSPSLLVFLPPQEKTNQQTSKKQKKQSKFDLEAEDKKNHLVEWPLLNSHSPFHYSRCFKSCVSRCFKSCVYQLRFLVDSNGRTACNHKGGRGLGPGTEPQTVLSSPALSLL